MGSRNAVERYLADRREIGASSRSIIGRIRRQVIAFAVARHRRDLAEVLARATPGDAKAARKACGLLESLPGLSPRIPLAGDDVERWLPVRLAAALRAAGVRTLANLAVRMQAGRRWWTSIAGVGAAGATQVETFFAAHPQLAQAVRALVVRPAPQDLVPWERLVVPETVDGSAGTFRAPRATCALAADNDYQAVHAWLSLHEAAATQRAYRKEAERLILWAIVERGRALSSLTTEDAIAYRAFLRHPAPRLRWIGPPRPRSSPEWRPFAAALSPRSAAYALSVLGALYRWLIEQRYVLANPFAGVKVRGTRPASLDTGRAFAEGEWTLLRTVADGLEWSYGWQAPAAQRLRFLLDFAFATGLRAGELVGATLGDIDTDAHGDHWLKVVGKGARPGRITLPPLARISLDRYLVQRGLPVTPSKWKPATPIVGALGSEAGITSARLWRVMKRFFETAAGVVEDVSPAMAEKLRRATPHWLRHTHATHALGAGASLTSVRDNLRHASISTTSGYLHADDERRARQFEAAFAGAKE